MNSLINWHPHVHFYHVKLSTQASKVLASKLHYYSQKNTVNGFLNRLTFVYCIFFHIIEAFFSTEQEIKWVQCMSTNVKEALNNYHCVYDIVGFVHNYDVLLHFLSLVNTEHWQGVEVFCAIVCSLLDTQHFDSLHGLTILCQCVLVYVCVHGSAGLCPLHLSHWWYILKWCNDGLSSTLLFFLSTTHSGTQGQENKRWTKGI